MEQDKPKKRTQTNPNSLANLKNFRNRTHEEMVEINKLANAKRVENNKKRKTVKDLLNEFLDREVKGDWRKMAESMGVYKKGFTTYDLIMASLIQRSITGQGNMEAFDKLIQYAGLSVGVSTDTDCKSELILALKSRMSKEVEKTDDESTVQSEDS